MTRMLLAALLGLIVLGATPLAQAGACPSKGKSCCPKDADCGTTGSQKK